MINFLKSRKYFVAGGIVVLVVILFIYGYPKYRDWKFDREIKQLTEEINRPYLEDTYGGQTPKETLEMFIVAIEENDFELASKYIVLSKQEEWRETLINASAKNKINTLVLEVKKAIEEIGKDNQDWGIKDNYIAHTFTLFEFVKYPKGIWKIKEI